MNQLRIDLEKRIRERLQQWLQDSHELYEMAGLKPENAIEDIYYNLILLVVSGSIALKMPTNDLTDMIREMINKRTKKSKSK